MTKWCPQPAQVPVLREYALLADGYRGAVVGPDGAIAWLCAPVWESPSIFSSLLGGRGRYVVAPTWDRFVWGGYYEPESLIWVSRWVTAGGVIESREALACPASERRLVLLRQIRTFDQAAAVQVLLDPAAGYGRAPLRGLRRDGGVWSGRTAELHLRLTGGAGLAPSASRRFAGQPRTCRRWSARSRPGGVRRPDHRAGGTGGILAIHRARLAAVRGAAGGGRV